MLVRPRGALKVLFDLKQSGLLNCHVEVAEVDGQFIVPCFPDRHHVLGPVGEHTAFGFQVGGF